MNYEIAIVGGGILGSSIAYWLSETSFARTVVTEKNSNVGLEASSRNTGNLHRPFYLDPIARKKFAIAADLGYDMWKKMAKAEEETGLLPWKEMGTLELATDEQQMETLRKYVEWGKRNGMREEEMMLFEDGEKVKILAPVECVGALLCKTDAAVDFGVFTKYLRSHSEECGVKFSLNSEVGDVVCKEDSVDVFLKGRQEPVNAKLLVNCAGGNAVDIAHKCGLGLEYTDLHFRGDYWIVDPYFGREFSCNIYTVPEHPKFQFLDPHLIIKADVSYEIGPSAVPVAGPDNYESLGLLNAPTKLLERPVMNKLRLAANTEFLSLAFNELRHLSKEGMIKRMNRFIPSLKPSHIIRKGASGIRHSLIASNGSFVPEAIELSDKHSYHVLNYNSPGASGAIAYAAYVVNDINEQLPGRLRRAAQRRGLFDFDDVVRRFEN